MAVSDSDERWPVQENKITRDKCYYYLLSWTLVKCLTKGVVVHEVLQPQSAKKWAQGRVSRTFKNMHQYLLAHVSLVANWGINLLPRATSVPFTGHNWLKMTLRSTGPEVIAKLRGWMQPEALRHMCNKKYTKCIKITNLSYIICGCKESNWWIINLPVRCFHPSENIPTFFKPQLQWY